MEDIAKLDDVNSDQLDDRLIDPKQQAISSLDFHSLLSRIENVRIVNLPSEILSEMHQDIVNEQAILKNKLGNLEIKIHKNLIKGNASFYEDARKDCRKFAKMYDDLEDYRIKIYDARQEKIIREGVSAYFGSQTYSNVMEGVIMAMIIVILSVMSYDILYLDPVEDASLKSNIFWLDFVFCIVFLSEFYFRFTFSEDKKWFFRNNWIDLVTSIPIPDGGALRYGRTVRLARLFRIARLLRVIRIVFFFWKGFDKFTDVMDVKLMKKSLKGVLLVIFVGAFLIWLQEGNEDPSIATLAESLWWSFTTVVTGGFGDIYNPQTEFGRIITIFLVITGMILAGVFTATLTTIMTGEENEEIHVIQQNLEDKLERVEKVQEKILRELKKKS